jgi:predicted DNA-binding transcriptional regulator AlpA
LWAEFLINRHWFKSFPSLSMRNQIGCAFMPRKSTPPQFKLSALAPLGDQPQKREQPRRRPRALPSKRSDGVADQPRWVTGPTLREMLNISAPTLWRWRRGGGFPIPKVINGRLYFAADQVEAWMAAQPNAA